MLFGKNLIYPISQTHAGPNNRRRVITDNTALRGSDVVHVSHYMRRLDPLVVRQELLQELTGRLYDFW